MKYAVTAVALAAMASGQASIIIDHFNNPSAGQSATIINPSGVTGPLLSTATSLPNVLGNARTIYVGTTASEGRSKIAAGANVDPDFFTLSNDSTSIDGYAGVIWDGDDGGLNYDLSECSLIRWDADEDKPTLFSLTLWSYDNNASAKYQVLGLGGTVSTYTAPLSFFAGAGVDLTDVDYIELQADPLEGGGDVRIHLVECDIPEPATTGVAFAALAGLGMVIRRFRKA